MDDLELENLSDYETHVVRQNMAYTMAFEQFEAGLTQKQRAYLGRHGTPDLEDHRAQPTKRELIGITKDAAESSLASYRPDMATAIDGIKDELLEIGIPKGIVERLSKWHQERVNRESEAAKASMIVKLVGVLIQASNVRISVAGLAYASDLALVNGMGTMDAWAKKHALSRQAVSKAANFWRRTLQLPGGGHMRDDKAREAYKTAQLNNHWRNKKYGSSPAN